MALQGLPFATDYKMGEPLAAIFQADLASQQQQDAQLDMIKKQLENEKSAAMNPLEIRLKELGIPLSELKAAQARIQMSPKNLARYGDQLGYDYNKAQRADELAGLEHPLLKRYQEIRTKYGLGEGQPSSGTIGFPTTKQPEQVAQPSSVVDIVRQLESGGRGDTNPDGTPLTSKKGALFGMQVMPSTASAPGFGIKPASAQTPEEYNRVGSEYINKMVERYGGDVSKALAAYNAGPGVVDAALQKEAKSKKLGEFDPSVQQLGWLDFMPAETRAYVENGLGLQNQQGQEQQPTAMDQVQQPVQQLQSAGQVAGLMDNPEAKRIMEALMFDPKYMERLQIAKEQKKVDSLITQKRILDLYKNNTNPISEEHAAALGRPELAGKPLEKALASTDISRSQRMLQGASNSISAIESIMKFPGDATTGILPNLTTQDGMFNAVRNMAGRELSTTEAKMMNTLFAGIGRSLSQVETGGMASGLSELSKKLESAVYINPGDDPTTVAMKLADVRRMIIENLEPSIGVTLKGPQADKAREIIARVKKAIPFSTEQVIEAHNARSGTKRTIGDESKKATATTQGGASVSNW